LQFHAALSSLENKQAFELFLKPARQCEWVVYAKRPFSGPEAVLRYLSLYTHRVAISNSRLITADNNNVTFKWKDLANAVRAEKLQQVREALSVPSPETDTAEEDSENSFTCRQCGTPLQRS